MLTRIDSRLASAILALFVLQMWTVPGIAAASSAGDDQPEAAPSPSYSSEVMPPIALGLYQPVFPDDLSGLEAYEGASSRRTAIVHWYAHWGDWKSAFNRD